MNFIHPPRRFLYPVHGTILRATKSSESHRCELDSHADTFVAGSNTRLISTTRKVVNIHGFTKGVELKNVPIASIATVFVDSNGNRILLVVHQALYLGAKHAVCLVNPNQLQNNSIAVHDRPSQFDSSSRHAIYLPESNMTIPLQLDGIISYFDSFKPTDEEMVYLPQVVLTSVDEWDPYSNAFTKKEEVARRCAVVAKECSNWMQLQEEVERKEMELRPFHSIDYNFSSSMAVCARRVTSVECYQEHITTDSHSLSGEDLYESLVKCIRVASDDSEGKDLAEDQQEDVYEHQVVHYLSSEDKQSVLTPEVI
jgi:hypothetical protein